MEKTVAIISSKKIKLLAFSETMVPLNVNGSFSAALIEGSQSLLEGVCVMEGIVSVQNSKGNALSANFTHLPISVPAYTSVAQLHTGPLTALPNASCLVSHPAKPDLNSVDHIQRIDLSHIPSHCQEKYWSLIHKYGDVFFQVRFGHRAQ